MSKRKSVEFFLSELSESKEEIFYKPYKDLHNSDEEDLRFPRKKNINRMTSSNSDSDINKYNM